MKLAQRINEQRDTAIKQRQSGALEPRDTFVRERFKELFSLELPRDYEQAWRRLDHQEVNYVLTDVATRWWLGHMHSTALDLARVINSVLRKRSS